LAKPNPKEPQAILTSRPLELVMFDLHKILGLRNAYDVQAYLLMIVDHFSKYKWGRVVWGKAAATIAFNLVEIFEQEGTPERWHADNGSEFNNAMVEQARALLSKGNPLYEGWVPYTHGAVRYIHTRLFFVATSFLSGPSLIFVCVQESAVPGAG
jgi:transposase InsO family protein